MRLSADEMIGKIVLFAGTEIGRIDQAKYGPTQQNGMAWTFRLDVNSHWIGDIRKSKSGKWAVKCSHDPTIASGGMYHCPECGEMVIAGATHPNYTNEMGKGAG